VEVFTVSPLFAKDRISVKRKKEKGKFQVSTPKLDCADEADCAIL
jgi:hypothetical protein